MRSKKSLIFLLAALVSGLMSAPGYSQLTPDQLEKKAKEAIASATKKRAELGSKFLPKPQDLGPGWLAPWNLPDRIKKYSSEVEYWQSFAGDLNKDNKAFFAALISVLLELSPEELKAFTDTWVSMASKEMKAADLPTGMTTEQFALTPILLLLRWEYSPSLADKWEMVTSYLEEMQKFMAGEVEKRFGAAAASATEPARSQRDFMQDILIKPFQGVPAVRMREEIMTWGAAWKDMTGMIYTTCDNWTALRSGDEKTLLSIHLRHAVVTLNILDRNKIAAVAHDMTAIQGAALQQRMNSRLGQFREFGFDVLLKKRSAELGQEIEVERSLERKKKLETERARLPELAAKLRDQMPKVDFEVGSRDFGDNCYVIQMKGSAKLPEFAFPATNLQACLRNGNAVVFIGLGGNSTPELLNKELDLILSEMDTRTAFFRLRGPRSAAEEL
jgi:hypothetical protein